MAGIVSDEQQAKLMSEYDKWLETARPELQPQPPAFADTEGLTSRQARYAKFQEDLAKFRSNPGFQIRDNAQKKVLAYFPGKTLAAPEVSAAVDLELAANRKAYEAGLNEGIKDGSHINNAMNALFQFPPQIFTAVKQLFLSIPLVGDALAAGGKSLMSLFSGKPINPLTAYDRVKTERAMAGGLSRLGITDKPSVDAITSPVVSGDGFPGMPEKVVGKAYAPNAPEVLRDAEKLAAFQEVRHIFATNPGMQIMTVNGNDGKPLTVIGSRSGDSFTIKGIFKTGDDEGLVKLDARQPDGRSIEGETITLVNGAIAEIGRGMVTGAAARVTQANKAYAPDAPEVSERVAMAGASGVVINNNSRIIVTKDSAGKDIVVVGMLTGDDFTVDAVLKPGPNGTSLVKALKQPEGTMPLAGETITLVGGALPAEAAARLKGEVDTINANEIKPGQLFDGQSNQIEVNQLQDRLFTENKEAYQDIQNRGKFAVALKDEKGAISALAIGSRVENKFIPERVLKAGADGTLKEVQAEVLKAQLLDLTPNATLTENAMKALKESVGKDFKDDGKLVVVMTTELREAAEKYARTRFVNLETGEVDQTKVDKFVKIYTDRVINAGMPESAQKARAAEIEARTKEALAKFASAKESAVRAENAGATLANPADAVYAPMQADIKEALEILAGRKPGKALDDNLEAAVKELSKAELPPPPATPVIATSKGLSAAANGK